MEEFMHKNLFKLCLSGLFISLIVVLSAYCQIPLGSSIRLDIGYAVVVIAAMYFGPLYGGGIAFLARVLNDFIFSGSVSFWWAIGSAFFGFAIGLVYILFKRIKNEKLRAVAVAFAIAVISFISFAGIVPVVALTVGLNYSFMLGIGVLASVADALVGIVVGYPAYEVLKRKVFNKYK